MSKTYKQPGFLAAFFGFKRMVSPVFIRLFYYLGLLAIIAGAVAALMGKGPVYDELMQTGLNIGGAVGYYIAVVLVSLIIILIWRFYCELLIVLFSIFNRLGDISAALQDHNVASPPPPAPVIAPVPAPVEIHEEAQSEDKEAAEETGEDTPDEANTEETNAEDDAKDD